jgi:phage baseplate assembly protein W
MRSYFLDPETDDLAVDDFGNIKMVDGVDEQKQSVRLLLGTNTGEWFLDTLHGLAYQYLQVKNPNETEIRGAFLQAFDQEARIQEVQELTVDFNHSSRHLAVKFKLRMEDGTMIGEEEVIL